jgi:hypothetical protein
MKVLFFFVLALVLVSFPLPALADFVNQDIEDLDLMTGDWAKQYGDANIDAGWPQDISGPGVRWKATPTVSSGWVKIGVGDNFSIRTGTYGFPTIWVGTGYFADWTGHGTYQLAFTNNSATSYVFVKPYYTTGSAGYWHDASTWVAPGETRVVSVNLTTLAGGEPGTAPNLATVSHFGFELGMNYANPPTVYGEGNEFDVSVSAQFPVHNVTQDTWHLSIQDGVDNAVANDQLTVAAGLYDERIAINKSITLLGATSGVSKRGYAVPAGYAYDAATESIIRPSTPLELQVVKVAADGVVFDGFVVANEVCATGGVYQDLVGIDPSMTATTGVQILNCVLGPNTNTASQDGTKGRSGVTVYGPRALPLKLTVMHSKIFNSEGNGCGIMIVGPYGPSYYGGVPHVNQFAGSVIEDNDILGNHRTGIELAGGVQGGTAWADHVIIRDNLIAENGWFALAEKDNLKYGHGIMFIRCGGDKANADAAGSQYVRLENNEIRDNEKSGLYVGPKNSDLFGTGNVIQDNGKGTGGYSLWDGVRVDLAEFYYGGAALADYGFLTNVSFEQGGNFGNGALGVNVMQTPTAGPVSAICNWWGDILGPNVPPANPSPGDGVVGSVIYAPWLDGLDGVCDQYGANYVSAEPPPECLSIANTCMTVPVVFNRGDTTPLRGATVTFLLSPELELCAGVASVASGLLMNGAYMEVVDNGNGSYTVDQAFLGGTELDCGPVTGGTLFTIGVKPSAGAATDDTGTITILSVDARDCANPFNVLPGIPGPAAEITIDRTAPAAVSGLVAVQVKSGNDTDGTTKITLTFTAPGDAAQTWVYRKEFGFYPEYDDDGGAAPTAPVTPAAAVAAGWTLTSVTLSGQADEVATRDFWYYVAFVADACGNVSAVSDRTGGTLNYHLGDLSDGVTPGTGDNLVSTEDVSTLGNAYGTSDGDPFYQDYVDIGPTSDHSTNGRPTTDSRIQFEDLVIFAINYGGVSKPTPARLGADRNAVALSVAPGAGGLEAIMTLSSTGAVQSVSLPLTWNAEAVEPIAYRGGEMVDRQSGRALALSPEPGTVDAAALGSTFAGTGELAVVTFRVIGAGDPGIRFGEVIARDVENRPVTLETMVESRDLPVTPAVTRLLPSAPNPFMGATQVRFHLAETMPVAVRIYAVDGRLVRTLVDATLVAGEKVLTWDGRDDAGRTTAAGAYMLRMESRAGIESQRIARLQ